MKNKKTLIFVLLAIFAWSLPSRITSQKIEFAIPSIINTAHAAVPVPVVPTYIVIPNANVSTNIIEVGITNDGKLDVPNNYREVGWYKYGPRPGEMGSAVLDAHVDDGKKVPGPFKKLRNLKPGDKIYVHLSTGEILKYNVTLSEVFPTNEFPGQQVFHQTGKEYLKLITCHGKFVPSLKTYDQRLIVTAVLEK